MTTQRKGQYLYNRIAWKLNFVCMRKCNSNNINEFKASISNVLWNMSDSEFDDIMDYYKKL